MCESVQQKLGHTKMSDNHMFTKKERLNSIKLQVCCYYIFATSLKVDMLKCAIITSAKSVSKPWHLKCVVKEMTNAFRFSLKTCVIYQSSFYYELFS